MITVVYGSPRKGGNTEILADRFLQPVSNRAEIKKFYLRDLKLNPCTGCGKCEKSGMCVQNDDISDIYESIENSKGLILASPIYFISVTAQMKAFIDRAQPYWARKYLLKQTASDPTKKGFYISVGGVNTESHFINSLSVVKCFMNTLDINYSGNLFFPGVDAKGEINYVPGAMEKAEKAGEEFARLLGI